MALQEVWGGGTLAEQLNTAFIEFKAFCHDRKIVWSQPKFLPKMLARNGDTEFAGKAYNAARLQVKGALKPKGSKGPNN